MRVILLRHGIAEHPFAQAPSGSSDFARALTKEGATQIAKVAADLKGFITSLDLIVSSPLLRAKQTAEILSRVFPNAPRLETDELAPEFDCKDFIPWLKQYGPGIGTLLVVGHEPNLCALAATFLDLRRYSALGFDPGGMACFEIGNLHEIGTGRLLWLLQPYLFFGHLPPSD